MFAPFAKVLRRLKYLRDRRRLRDELAEEMQLHRELRSEANGDAARLFGNRTLLIEQSAEIWGWRWLDDVLRELRHAARLLARNPAFALTAVLTLALGIGANTAIFSLMNALLLRALPVPDASRIVRLSCDRMPQFANGTGNPHTSFSYFVFDQLREQQRDTAEVMAYVPLSFGKTSVRVGRSPEEAVVEMVSGNFFEGLKVGTACGRVLSMADERAPAAVTVVTYGFANRRFGAACAAINQSIFVEGKPFTIVGVAAPAFQGVSSKPDDLWIPFGVYPEFNAWGFPGNSFLADPKWWCMRLIARLRPEIALAAAQRRLNLAFGRAAYATVGGKPSPGEHPVRLFLEPARGVPGTREVHDALFVLQAMVALLLLIACGNVAVLLAVRNESRIREFSVRLAIGGSAGRLFRQLLTESAALVVAGTVLGFGFAAVAVRVIARWAKIDFFVAPDRTVLLVMLCVSAVVTLAFGVATALRATRSPVTGALRVFSTLSHGDRGRLRWSSAITSLQLALCLALLVATGLLVRTLDHLRSVNLGMKARELLVFGVHPNLPERAQMLAFYRGLLDKLRTVPGVESATLAQLRPGAGWSNVTEVVIDGAKPGKLDSNLFRWNEVGPDFFVTLGIPLIAGRDFKDADTENAPLVAVVDRKFAEAFFGGGNALGHTVSYTRKKQFRVVGVVENSKYSGIKEDALPTAWFPYEQALPTGTMQVEIRSSQPMAALKLVRKALAQWAPDLALLQPATQQAVFDDTIASEMLMARLSSAFGALAMLLVSIGLYGVIAYGVARRTSEIGLRLAVGANTSSILWMILRRGLWLCVAGIALAVPLVRAVTQLLRSLLYGVAPGDPVSIAAACGGLSLVALLASYLPARRAAKVDPVVALRWE